MDIVTLAKNLPSRLFYLSDIAAGSLAGRRCLCCGSSERRVVAFKHLGLGSVYECLTCGLYYRPSSAIASRFADLYYGYAYRDAGVATKVDAAANHVERARLVAKEGKNRLPLVNEIASRHGLDLSDGICVFGCSWGYEMLCLAQLGVPVFGIEVSTPRRRLGQERFGLDIYASLEEAPRVRPALVISSHVIEHIPSPAATLRDIQRYLQPHVQVHITPSVEHSPSAARNGVGREHPVGITRRFWEHWVQTQPLELQLVEGGQLPGTYPTELGAVLALRSASGLAPHG